MRPTTLPTTTNMNPSASTRKRFLTGIRNIGICFLIAAVVVPARISACPFCSAVSQTLRQEMEAMDAVVIATALQSDLTRNADTGEVKMQIEKVLKGSEYVEEKQEVIAVYFGDVAKGRRFMLSGVDPRDMQWSCLPLTPRAEKYIIEITELAKEDDAKRLRFYYDYLQDEDSMLSRDAYDEFAIAPYDVVKELKDEMDHDQLVAWIKDPEMSPDRKRLYLTMLGICGGKDDIKMLEEMLQSTQKSARSGLDALIACHLTLSGEEGLPLIEELFLTNQKASYADTYAAIMAIRFHGTEGGVIARSALVESLHHILARKDLADLVIPDLARWQDWSQVATVKKLFLEADPNNNWIRVPVINYLRACPLPEAKEAIEELKEVDPDSVRRANTFFSVPKPAAEVKPSTSSWDYVPQQDRAGLTPGTRYASRPIAAASQGPEASAATETRSRVTPASANPVPSVNPVQSLYVMALGLATLLIGQWLILTGGATSTKELELAVVPVASRDD